MTRDKPIQEKADGQTCPELHFPSGIRHTVLYEWTFLEGLLEEECTCVSHIWADIRACASHHQPWVTHNWKMQTSPARALQLWTEHTSLFLPPGTFQPWTKHTRLFLEDHSNLGLNTPHFSSKESPTSFPDRAIPTLESNIVSFFWRDTQPWKQQAATKNTFFPGENLCVIRGQEEAWCFIYIYIYILVMFIYFIRYAFYIYIYILVMFIYFRYAFSAFMSLTVGFTTTLHSKGEVQSESIHRPVVKDYRVLLVG